MPAVLLTFNEPAASPSNGACTFSHPAGASAWVVRATGARQEKDFSSAGSDVAERHPQELGRTKRNAVEYGGTAAEYGELLPWCGPLALAHSRIKELTIFKG